MKIIHIMKEQKFTVDACEFYDFFFNNGEHEIGLLNLTGKDSLKMDQFTIPQHEVIFDRNILGNLVRFCRLVKGYDYIVMHSFLFPWWLRVFLACCGSMCRKIVWIEWGADLYSWKTSGSGIATKLLNWADKRIRTRCNAVVCIFPPDQKVYRREFPDSKAQVFCAPYCGGTVVEEYKHYSPESRLRRSRENGETIYIQIGHCATPEVDHLCTLRSLRKFADRDIHLILPLSYGDMKYGDKVQKYAEEAFPGKVTCLREMLPMDEYYEMLKRIDIAVFHTFRQIGLANITRMVFRNVKVYLPEDSVMYEYFTDNGVPIGRSEELENCDFDMLVADAKVVQQEAFDRYISSFKDKKVQVEQWNVVYDTIRRDL